MGSKRDNHKEYRGPSYAEIYAAQVQASERLSRSAGQQPGKNSDIHTASHGSGYQGHTSFPDNMTHTESGYSGYDNMQVPSSGHIRSNAGPSRRTEVPSHRIWSQNAYGCRDDDQAEEPFDMDVLVHRIGSLRVTHQTTATQDGLAALREIAYLAAANEGLRYRLGRFFLEERRDQLLRDNERLQGELNKREERSDNTES
jgi:hypothetical protein